MTDRLPNTGRSGDGSGWGERKAVNGRACVIHPITEDDSDPRDPLARLDEAVGLAQAIDLDIAEAEAIKVRAVKPARYFGNGKISDIAADIEAKEIDVAVINAPLTPVQQRNLETAFGTKVIDRTGLILEIFGARARTREGRMQVELAALTYQRSRLVRSWTHLERQRGGFGFLGGPGESQIEADRRQIDGRIVQLRRDLGKVSRTRGIQRAARQRVPFPVVALVGYTNAGKSTLFNRLTGAGVLAQDQVFATLDPTMRRLDLPSGRTVILSDTVGFISNLPTSLVAAFKATLEEVVEADLIVHVRDISHPDHAVHAEEVEAVLKELKVDSEETGRLIEAHNKVDLLDQNSASAVAESARRSGLAVAISAQSGIGLPELAEAIENTLTRNHAVYGLEIPLTEGAAIAWLYQYGKVVAREDGIEHAQIRVQLNQAELARFKDRFAL